jgi:hypothetical protein
MTFTYNKGMFPEQPVSNVFLTKTDHVHMHMHVCTI